MERCRISRPSNSAYVKSPFVPFKNKSSDLLTFFVVLKRSICQHAAQFGGSEQHDSQEFLSFLLDGLHEDLNRILNKPTYEVTQTREEELEKLPQQVASEQEWKVYRMRNNSLVVDFFQGQFRNRLECLTCRKVSRVRTHSSIV
jgi:ubiquitin carboxyl-terminal hydrolase 8